MPITDDVIELKSLDTEIKRTRKRLKQLKEQKTQCEARIIEYLDVNNQPGVKMDGTIIMLQDRNKRKYTKKQVKLERGEQILQRHGVYDSRKTLDELLEAMRGSPERTPGLKIY
jgi:septal ring factor EnvC (AmiA/AmiB activator)